MTRFIRFRFAALAGLALATGLALGLGSMEVRPAAAAAPDVRVQVTGATRIYPFRTYTYQLTVTNHTQETVSGVGVSVRGLETPLDFKSFAVEGATQGFDCKVKVTSAILGARAWCFDGTLAPGQTVTLKLRTQTGVFLFSGQGELKAAVFQSPNGNTYHTFTTSKAIIF